MGQSRRLKSSRADLSQRSERSLAGVPTTGVPAPSHPLLSLQRQIGNRAVVALLKASGGNGTAAASPPPSVSRVTAVQRQIATKATELEAARDRVEGPIGRQSGYDRVWTKLKEYEAACAKKATPEDKIKLLGPLVKLSDDWLEKYERSRESSIAMKRALIRRMRDEAYIEKVHLQTQEGYLKALQGDQMTALSQTAPIAATESIKTVELAGTRKKPTDEQQVVKDYGLTAAELAAIKLYTMDDFRYINPAVANDAKMLAEKNKKLPSLEDADMKAEEKAEKWRTQAWLRRLRLEAGKRWAAEGWQRGDLPLRGARPFMRGVNPFMEGKPFGSRTRPDWRKWQVDDVGEEPWQVDSDALTSSSEDESVKGPRDDKGKEREDAYVKPLGDKGKEREDAYSVKPLGDKGKAPAQKRSATSVTEENLDYARQGAAHGGMLVLALSKLPAWKGSTYRGARYTQEEVDKQFQVGKFLPLAGFTSTSKQRGESLTFAYKGTPQEKNERPLSVLTELQVVAGRDISKLSAKKDEEEVLLMPDARCRITEVRTDPDQSDLLLVTAKQES